MVKNIRLTTGKSRIGMNNKLLIPKIKDCIRIIAISRPREWIFYSILFIGTFIYFKVPLNSIALLQLVSFFLPLTFFWSYINNKYDVKTDYNNQFKVKNIYSGDVFLEGDQKLEKFVIPSVIVVILISLITLNIQNIILIIFLIFSHYVYNAPPRLKEIPFLSSIVVFFHWFPIALIAYSYGNNIFLIPSKVIYALLLIIPLHILTSIADYSADNRGKVTTIATYLGIRYSSLFVITIPIFVFLLANFSNIFIILFIIYQILFGIIIFLTASEKIANLAWKIFPTFILTISILLIFFST